MVPIRLVVICLWILVDASFRAVREVFTVLWQLVLCVDRRGVCVWVHGAGADAIEMFGRLIR